MKANVVRIHRHGGPEVLCHETVDIPPPGSGEVLIRQTAIGLNYSDIYQRQGEAGPHDAYPFPIVLGGQGAGVVEAVGHDVDGFRPGDRVAYLHPGAYADRRLVPASRLLALPADISDDVAGAVLLRGLTAEYLLRRLYRVRPGTTMLVHAAAGGMGLLLGQWGKALGAHTIGTVGSAAKVSVARANGYDAVIDTGTDDFSPAVLALTGGTGVDVVYDGIGKDGFLPSLDCVRAMGIVISYGTASGNVGMFDLQALHRKSIIVTRPTLRTWIAARADYEAAASAVFDALRAGILRGEPARRYQLADARRAHEDLQARRTTGAAILVPG
ncbi:quinone oxidoreductase [Roseomonas sp. SSH11]|uniref:Quinone oxidoreductase n=1 Tax=Pararoseomonas baculiformis TaxID=2820812 RepID=A0ABS4ADK7_9PROT|nr:quinone oxidoreductase [Pararoseomonas baculiformis]MBP0445100.1 quinone oxidoreductase [Pararoseomonas baculiformis]